MCEAVGGGWGYLDGAHEAVLDDLHRSLGLVVFVVPGHELLVPRLLLELLDLAAEQHSRVCLFVDEEDTNRHQRAGNKDHPKHPPPPRALSQKPAGNGPNNRPKQRPKTVPRRCQPTLIRAEQVRDHTSTEHETTRPSNPRQKPKHNHRGDIRRQSTPDLPHAEPGICTIQHTAAPIDL